MGTPRDGRRGEEKDVASGGASGVEAASPVGVGEDGVERDGGRGLTESKAMVGGALKVAENAFDCAPVFGARVVEVAADFCHGDRYVWSGASGKVIEAAYSRAVGDGGHAGDVGGGGRAHGRGQRSGGGWCWGSFAGGVLCDHAETLEDFRSVLALVDGDSGRCAVKAEAQAPGEGAEVVEREVCGQFLVEGSGVGWGRTCEDDVVDPDEGNENGGARASVVEAWVMGALFERFGCEGRVEGVVPNSLGLFGAVEASDEPAYFVWLGMVVEPGGLEHVNFLVEVAVKEGCLDVKLVEVEGKTGSEGNDEAEGLTAHDWGKGF